MPEAMMSRAEVAAYLGVTERTIDNLQTRGSLMPVKVGTRSVYRREEVEEYVTRNRRSHRVVLTDDDFKAFQVSHGNVPAKGEGSRKSERHVTINVRCPGPGDRDVVLSPDQWGALLLLAQAGGYPTSQLEALPELGNRDGAKLAEALEAAAAVVGVLKQGRGAKLGSKSTQL